MQSRGHKKPLYRKVNTRARGVYHHFGSDYRRDRRSESPDAFETPKASMGGKVLRGLDYTPLFKAFNFGFRIPNLREDLLIVLASLRWRLDNRSLGS